MDNNKLQLIENSDYIEQLLLDWKNFREETGEKINFGEFLRSDIITENGFYNPRKRKYITENCKNCNEEVLNEVAITGIVVSVIGLTYLAGLVSLNIINGIVQNLTRAGRKCKKYRKSNDKTKYRLCKINLSIQGLEEIKEKIQENIDKCDEKKNPSKCRRKANKKIKEIERKIEEKKKEKEVVQQIPTNTP